MFFRFLDFLTKTTSIHRLQLSNFTHILTCLNSFKDSVPSFSGTGCSISTMDFANFVMGDDTQDVISEPNFATSVSSAAASPALLSPKPTQCIDDSSTGTGIESSHVKFSQGTVHPISRLSLIVGFRVHRHNPSRISKCPPYSCCTVMGLSSFSSY
jgi:hypothetical protein